MIIEQLLKHLGEKEGLGEPTVACKDIGIEKIVDEPEHISEPITRQWMDDH